MRYYIDQSGKIENTKSLTVVAYAGDKTKSLKISAVEKRKLLKILKITTERKKLITYELFATLVFIIIKDEKINEVTIDVEYKGHEGSVKNFIKNNFIKLNRKIPDVSFELITKNSPAHKVAIDRFRGVRKADIIVDAREVLKYLF
ncbi:MAG: hypothetical protein QY322_01510 [bacterium]|nr:MAG: hypothetical protein QY322_01510 [bacterium]